MTRPQIVNLELEDIVSNDDKSNTEKYIEKLERELRSHKSFARWCVDMANTHGGSDFCRVKSQVEIDCLST